MFDLVNWYLRGKTQSLGHFINYLDSCDAKYITISCASTKWRDGQFWSHDDHVIVSSDSSKTFTLTLLANRGPGHNRHDNDQATARVSAVGSHIAGIIAEQVPGIRVIFKDARGSHELEKEQPSMQT